MNKIYYKILLKSNFLTAQTGVIGKSIDSAFKRDINGNPIIYGKLIKGILRDKFRQYLSSLDENDDENKINNIFGSEGNNISKLYFSNLYIQNDKGFEYNTRHSIKVDRKTKTIIEGSLFNYEFIEMGTEFCGDILFKENIEEEILKILIASFLHIDKMGGFKSRGLGDIEIKIKFNDQYVGIEKLDEIVKLIYVKNKNEKEEKFKRYGFDLEFLSPLVLQENVQSNLVTSRTNLQGSTIRGALINIGLENGYKIEELRKIEVKLYNKNENLKSEFTTKYKVDGIYKEIDKSIIINDSEILNDNSGNKFERKNGVDFKNKSDDISIKINYNTRTAEEKMLFNHEVIEKNLEDENENLYYGNIYIPENLLELSDILYIGKYKSKGFGKVRIKLKDYKEEKIDLKYKIKKYNRLINDNSKVYLTFDFKSDCILPFDIIYNILNQFKELIGLQNVNDISIKRTFVSIEKLRGYNIINNTRKADEIVIAKGSVLTYEFNNYDELYSNLNLLENIEKNGIGLRKKEGFGIVGVCTLTKIRREIR